MWTLKNAMVNAAAVLKVNGWQTSPSRTVATVYGMDVLLKWNCTHINNPITLPVVYSEIARAGYNPPKILDARQFMEAYDEH